MYCVFNVAEESALGQKGVGQEDGDVSGGVYGKYRGLPSNMRPDWKGRQMVWGVCKVAEEQRLGLSVSFTLRGRENGGAVRMGAQKTVYWSIWIAKHWP